MMKRTTKKALCFVLAFVLLVLSIPATASNEEPELDNEMIVSTTAGMHGYYEYDMETDVETFVPPPDSVEHHETEISTEEGQEDEDGSPRWVIGADNRKIVTNPSGEKRSICLIGSRWGDFVGTGTAWLLNKNHLVTAGHVIYDNTRVSSNLNGIHYANHVAVYVGASGGKYSHYRLATKVYAGGDFRDHHADGTQLSRFDDWGVITLDSPVVMSSYMKLKTVNSASEMSGKYTTTGYPKKLSENKYDIWNKYDMYTVEGKIIGNLPMPRFLDVVKTDMDCTQGQSGSPVYQQISGVYYVSAIVVAEEDLGSAWDEPKENYLLLINDWLYNKLTYDYS